MSLRQQTVGGVAVDQEDFATALAADAKTRQQWLAIMTFGKYTLLKDPYFLTKLIVDRAQKEKSDGDDRELRSIVVTLMDLLGLTLSQRAEK